MRTRAGKLDLGGFGRTAEVDDYLITEDDAAPGRRQTYGLGDDEIDLVSRLLRQRGLLLVADDRGLVVERVDGLTVRAIARRIQRLAGEDNLSDVQAIVNGVLANDSGASVDSILQIVVDSLK